MSDCLDGDDLPTGVLHPFDDLGLDDERAEQAVEVGDHDYLSGTSLDGLDSGSQALSLGEGSTTAYVDFLMDGDEFQGFPLADGDDSLPLFGGAEAVFPSLGLSDDADGLDGRAPYFICDRGRPAYVVLSVTMVFGLGMGKTA